MRSRKDYTYNTAVKATARRPLWLNRLTHNVLHEMATTLDMKPPMTRPALITGAALLGMTLGLHGAAVRAQEQPRATFRSSVDLVRVAAVVRDHRGRFVQDLT